jgi:predicted HicB family RNase H-like nuclease
MKTRGINPFGLRLQPDLKDAAKAEAKKHHHSLNVELSLLIEDGFKWRDQQIKQARA